MQAPRFVVRNSAAPHAAPPIRLPVVLLFALATTFPATASAEPDLAPNSDTECVRGGSCLIDVTIENRGDLSFSGAAGLRGMFNPRIPVESVSAESGKLKCSVTGEAAYECSGSALSIEPGEATGIQVVIDIPDDFNPKSITHTDEMMWPDETARNGNTGNDRRVSTITIIDPAMLPAVDLTIDNSDVQGACTAGRPCGFTLTATNMGPAIYDGTIVITGGADSAAVRLAGFTGADWTCQGAGERYVCAHPETTLQPGQSRSLVLMLATGDFLRGTLTNCAEVNRGKRIRVRDVQRALNEAGYSAGIVDGIAGRRTRAAVAALQEANGLAVTGEIDWELANRLFGAKKFNDINPDNDRGCAAVQLLAPPKAESEILADQPAGGELQDAGQ